MNMILRRTGAPPHAPHITRSGPTVTCRVGGCFQEARWDIVFHAPRRMLWVCTACRDELLALEMAR